MSATTAHDQTAWAQVLEVAEEMAGELREDGWDVCLVRAGHVSAVPSGESPAQHGLVYVAPDSVEAELPGLVAGTTFDRYVVFREAVARDLFVVTQMMALEAKRAVVLVGAIDRQQASDLAVDAREREELYSHVRLLDGTHLATFHHEDPAHVFPEER
ncbi:hypothetical protein [Halorhabdus sp. CUG00001]|uniref:DUF7529 family protein n=1 Tax=Halorhabdus sp. CUG00001 TaxID=2600297 RepID=UPI00131C5C4F|nr:hypothetical protein [Halorhabdus sp. CUG00001]